MQIGIWELLVIGLILLLLFGRGKVSELMGDVGKGISSFKKGLTEGGAKPADAPAPPPAADPVPPALISPPAPPVAAKPEAPQPPKG